jgi:hypothetical protein
MVLPQEELSIHIKAVNLYDAYTQEAEVFGKMQHIFVQQGGKNLGRTSIKPKTVAGSAYWNETIQIECNPGKIEFIIGMEYGYGWAGLCVCVCVCVHGYSYTD